MSILERGGMSGSVSVSTLNHKASDILSPELKAFYESHDVNVDAILTECNDDASVRFVRLNPRFNGSNTLVRLEQEVLHQHDTATLAKRSMMKPRPVPWLKNGFGFYAIPATTKLQQLDCFQSGRIYGMDVSSGAAVSVLMSSQFDKNKEMNSSQTIEPTPPQRVLDLCCAPGLKLCMLADMLTPDENIHTMDINRKSSTVVVGVDISESRLALCKKIVKKYHVDSQICSSDDSGGANTTATIQIYRGNGVTFESNTNDNNSAAELVFDSQVAKEEAGGKRKRMNKSARARERKRLKQVVTNEQQQCQHRVADSKGTNHVLPSSLLFDRVLVDAECSTDGSLKHVQQQVKKWQQQSKAKNDGDNNNKMSNKIENRQLTDQNQLEDLVELQRGLLASGYRNLQRGGLLVYSTCSLSTSQNEGVVQWLLDAEKDAFLVPLEFHDTVNSNFIREGSIQGTIRFVPSTSSGDSSFSGGGFFVAKIGKKQLAAS